MTTQDHPIDQIEAYALGLLAQDAEASVGEHLRQCVACQQRLEDVERTLGLLALDATPLPPPPGAEDRLMARIAALRAAEQPVRPAEHAPAAATGDQTVTRSARRPAVRAAKTPGALRGVGAISRAQRGWPRSWPRSARAAAFGMASLAAVLLIALGLVAAQLSVTRAGAARLSTQAQTQQRTLDLLNAPGSVVMRLAPTATQVRGASATMILDPARGQGALLTSHLPALPMGKTYEFWLVLAQGDGAPQTTPILVFAGSSSASVTVFFSTSASASAVRGAGVSVERSGGVHTPDSPMLLNTR